MPADEHLVWLARAEGPHGEIALRSRRSISAAGVVEVDELVVNGIFAMDSAETRTEQALGALAASVGLGSRVLVGGLGLGYTVREICRFDVAAVDVVEIEPHLLDWALAGLTPTLAAALADPRVRVHLGDIAEVFGGTAGLGAELGRRRWDAIVLDVDNGPDFLIHPENRRLYGPDLLAAAAGRLNRGGLLAIWCSGPAPVLEEALRRLGGRTEERRIEVVRGTRRLTYAVYAHWPAAA